MPFWLGIVLLIVGIALAITSGALLWRWNQVASQLRELTAQAGTTDAQARSELARAQTMLLTIEVLNPLELARENSRIGARLAAVAPGLVRKRVYQTIAQELTEELEERGVEANIEIQRAGER